ncbi:MAG: hypothetical protein OEV44_01335 [Spirochaetota bacterium]|nr:hypothetical protein [Spirochaetota bacterium]
MRILFDNKFFNSTLTATNASLNYPTSNLIHPFLRRRFQSTGTTSIITASFASDISANSFFYGYTTAANIIVRLYDSLSALLDTINITDIMQTDAVYFTQRNNIRSVEIEITGADPLYLGGIGLGIYTQIKDPVNTWSNSLIDNSTLISSPAGQNLQNYIEPLRVYSFLFRDLTLNDFYSIQDLYKLKGIGYNLYMDLFESNHTFISPIYAKITSPINGQKNGRRYDFNLNIEEVR